MAVRTQRAKWSRSVWALAGPCGQPHSLWATGPGSPALIHPVGSSSTCLYRRHLLTGDGGTTAVQVQPWWYFFLGLPCSLCTWAPSSELDCATLEWSSSRVNEHDPEVQPHLPSIPLSSGLVTRPSLSSYQGSFCFWASFSHSQTVLVGLSC